MVPDFNPFFGENYFSTLVVDTFLYLKWYPLPHSIPSIKNLGAVYLSKNFINIFVNFKFLEVILSPLKKSLKDQEKPKWVFFDKLSPRLVKIRHLWNYLYTCSTLGCKIALPRFLNCRVVVLQLHCMYT